MKRLNRFVGIFLIALMPSLARSAPPSHAKVSLIADVSAIGTGKPFTIGALVAIDPGWHVYWTNPGDSGLPTQVKFTGPAGYTITPLPFPVPRQLAQNGNEIAYGYTDMVLLTAQVTPPAGAKIGDEAKFDAAVSWLVCKEECMPGRGSASLAVKVEASARPANAAEFDRYATTVTPNGEKSPAVTEIKSAIDAATHVATITVKWKEPVTDIQLFPGALDNAKVGSPKIGKTENDQTSITLPIIVVPGSPPAVEKVLVLIGFHDKAGKLRGIETSVPLK